MLLVLLGLAFKIAAFPLQMWAPDVYQGAPTPVTAFLAIGSKAAGFVLVLARAVRGRAGACRCIGTRCSCLAAASTILYGNLCAIPQRSLKRLLGYSSIANAGYMLLGVAALNASGSAAVLYYLAGYAFHAGGRLSGHLHRGSETTTTSPSLAGLSRRSPLLALGLTLVMVSLAGVPPLAGFLGNFFCFKAILERAGADQTYLLAGPDRHRRRGHFALLLFRHHSRHVLGRARAGHVADRGLGADENCAGVCIVAMFVPGNFPRRGPCQRAPTPSKRLVSEDGLNATCFEAMLPVMLSPEKNYG